MVKKCKEEGCNKQPTFGNEGGKTEYCAEHKKEGMIDVINKRCKDCNKIPGYGFEGGKAEYCADHKKERMINVKDKRCKEDECGKIPFFGNKGGKAGYCAEHKKEGMIDVKNKRCKDCNKQPVFGNKGGKAEYCGDHKKEGMIDVKNKKCKEEGCDKQPLYGNKGRKAEYCNDHKKEGMIDVKSKKCKEEGCNKQPSCGNEGGKAEYCVEHKKEGMVNVVSKRCESCNLFIVTSPRKFCSYCNPNSTKYQKTKEMEVVNFLKENNIEFNHNKSIGFVCGNYRPDILIDCSYHYIIVEVDENQHCQYSESCEIARMNNIYISQDLPCIFLRYNPDTYQRKGETERLTKKKRLSILLDTIEYHQENIPKTKMIFKYLFYDCDCDKCNYIHDKTDYEYNIIYNSY